MLQFGEMGSNSMKSCSTIQNELVHCHETCSAAILQKIISFFFFVIGFIRLA